MLLTNIDVDPHWSSNVQTPERFWVFYSTTSIGWLLRVNLPSARTEEPYLFVFLTPDAFSLAI